MEPQHVKAKARGSQATGFSGLTLWGVPGGKVAATECQEHRKLAAHVAGIGAVGTALFGEVACVISVS